MFTRNPFLDFFMGGGDRVTPDFGNISSISNIKANAASYNSSLLQNNRFLLFITSPSTMRYNSTDSEEEAYIGNQQGFSGGGSLPFLCYSTNLPGVTFNNRSFLPAGYGLETKVPYTQSFEPLTPTFYVDQNMSVFNFFTKWMQSIINFGGDDAINSPSTYNGAQMFEVSYKESYQSIVDIYVYNSSSDILMEYKFYNAYPTKIGDVGLSWEDTNQIMTCPITINYDYWTSNFFSPSNDYFYSNPNITYFNNLFTSGFQGYNIDPTNVSQNYISRNYILDRISERSTLRRYRRI